jgi:hypothetical protein
MLNYLLHTIVISMINYLLHIMVWDMDVHKVQIILEGSIHIDYIDQIVGLNPRSTTLEVRRLIITPLMRFHLIGKCILDCYPISLLNNII